jgi:hypothetical protein
MRNFLITLGLVLLVCGAAFGVSYLMSDDPAIRAAAREGDALAWLRAEFRLDEAQFAAVRRMHEEFSIECSKHCAAIVAARERQAPAAEIAALENFCVGEMRKHFRQVAAQMAPAQGERYLAVVLPRLADHSHQGAPTLRVTP